jgi:hypothetical protein
VALLARLLIHGVASLPEAPTKTTAAHRLRTNHHGDVTIGGGPGHAARKLRQQPHASLMTAAAGGDVVIGGVKKLLAKAADATGGGENKRQLLHDAVTKRATRIARKLADYDYDYRK